jgi:hypothetical protein
LQIPQLHEDRDEVATLKALLAFEPSDTTDGVIAGSTRQTWPSTERKKSRKRNWRSLTTVLDIDALEL